MNDNSMIVYVILHYKNWNDTLDCILSLKNIIKYQDKIIVVDNGSKDNSLNIIKKKICDNNVTFIKSPKNLGFAKGNNIGFCYGKYNKNADFICLLNSDVEIKDINFRQKLLNSYKSLKWDVLGTDILTLNGEHQNPFIYNPYGNKVFFNVYHHLKLLLKLYFNKNMAEPENKHNNLIDVVFNGENRIIECTVDNKWCIHGAIMIFSQKYISMFDGLYPKTFMYCEEYILRYICGRFNLKMCFDASLQILHKEGKSTKLVNKDYKKREIFYHRSVISSYMKLLCLKFKPRKFVLKEMNGNILEGLDIKNEVYDKC